MKKTTYQQKKFQKSSKLCWFNLITTNTTKIETKNDRKHRDTSMKIHRICDCITVYILEQVGKYLWSKIHNIVQTCEVRIVYSCKMVAKWVTQCTAEIWYTAKQFQQIMQEYQSTKNVKICLMYNCFVITVLHGNLQPNAYIWCWQNLTKYVNNRWPTFNYDIRRQTSCSQQL